MNQHLKDQQEAFKRQLKNQPIISKPVLLKPKTETNDTGKETSTPFTGNRPINSYIHSIITLLKSSNVPLDLSKINESLGINLEAHTDFLEKVCLNERISFNLSNKTLSYQPPYNIRSKADIIPVLKSQSNMDGLSLTELKDTIPKLEEAIAELVKSGDIYSLKIKEDGPRIIFYNDYKLSIPVSQEFKEMWLETSASADETLLRSAMEQSGLKCISKSAKMDFEASGNLENVRNPKKKPIKRPFRRIKITNDYLEGIDLSLDISDSK